MDLEQDIIRPKPPVFYPNEQEMDYGPELAGPVLEREPKEKHRVFVDMDGTLAQFKYVAFEELLEPGYYRNLEPMKNTVEAVKELIKRNNVEVFIMSAVLREAPTAQDEKNAWLDEYLPEIDKDHRCFMYCDEVKAEHIPGGQRSTDILLDDYTHNLETWAPPGIGIKLLNGLNDTHETWQGNKISMERDPKDIATRIEEISMDTGHTHDQKLQQDRAFLVGLSNSNFMTDWVNALVVKKQNDIKLYFGKDMATLMRASGMKDIDEFRKLPSIQASEHEYNGRRVKEIVSDIAQGNSVMESKLSDIADYLNNMSDKDCSNVLAMADKNKMEQGVSFEKFKENFYMFNKKEPERQKKHSMMIFNRETGETLGYADVNLQQYQIAIYDKEGHALSSTDPSMKEGIDKALKEIGEEHLIKRLASHALAMTLDMFILDNEKLEHSLAKLKEIGFSDIKIKNMLGIENGRVWVNKNTIIPIERYPDRYNTVSNIYKLIENEELEKTKEAEKPREQPKEQRQTRTGSKFDPDGPGNR